MKLFSLLLVHSLLAALAYSPSRAELGSDKRLLFLFDKIEVLGEVDVFLTQGKRLRECTVYADKEILSSVRTQVVNRTLFIDANNTYALGRRLPFLRLNAKRTFPVEVIVSVRDLEEIALTGAGNLTASGIRANRLRLFASGAGRLHLERFSAQRLEVVHHGTGPIVLKGPPVPPLPEMTATLAGSGPLLAGELPTQKVTLHHHDRAPAYLAPIDLLDARIRAQGNVFLTRRPRRNLIQTAGAGAVLDALPTAVPLYDANATRPALAPRQNVERGPEAANAPTLPTPPVAP